MEHIYQKKVNVGVHHGSVLSPLLVAIVIDALSNEIKEGTLREILYADDLVLIAETVEEQKNYTWKSALESKGLKVSLVKTKVMVSVIGQISINPSSKKDPCGICGRKTMLNAVLWKSCGNWIQGICAKIKRLTNTFAIDLKCRKCKGCHENIDDQKEKLHEDVETVKIFHI